MGSWDMAGSQETGCWQDSSRIYDGRAFLLLLRFKCKWILGLGFEQNPEEEEESEEEVSEEEESEEEEETMVSDFIFFDSWIHSMIF